LHAVLDGTDAVALRARAVGEYPVEAVVTMGQICAEAEAYLESSGRSSRGESISLSGLIEPITEAAVDSAHLMTEQLDAPLIVVSTESGRTALALSNRRPTATILALTRTEPIARILALCWGVLPLVRSDPSSAEHELKFAIDWARSHSLVRSGQYAVLLRGEVAGQPRIRAVLAGEVT
jgi:pyruvate kinase